MQPLFAPSALALLVTSLFATQPRAQCTDVWLPGNGTPGVLSRVLDAVLWDPDGAGPQGELVVLAATGNLAGDRVFRQFATWDPATGAWGSLDAALGQGGNSCLLVRANGELIAGGWHPDGAIVSRRTAGGWQQLGGVFGAGLLFGAEVRALAELPSGDLVAAGWLGSGADIVRWDGSQWQPMTGGLSGLPNDLAMSATGELYACGDFSPAQVVRWDGTQWQPVGGDLGFAPSKILFDAVGGLVATGRFPLSGGGVTGVLRWDGSSWSSMGFPTERARFASLPANGDLVVEAYPDDWYRWDGATWSLLVPTEYATLGAALTLPNGELLVAGAFRDLDGVAVSSVAAFDGSSWRPLADGFDDRALALVEGPAGELIAAGLFRSTPDGPAERIARFDGTSWSPLGAGLDGDVHAAVFDANGDLVVGGEFGMAGGVAASRVARWDGSGWSSLGGGLSGTVSALLVLPDGDILAGQAAAQGVMRWDGSSWSPLGNPPLFANALARLPDGSIVAGGFLGATRWNGTTWKPLTSASGDPVFGDVAAMLPMADGSLLLGGLSFYSATLPATGLLRWNGLFLEPFAAPLFEVSCLARAGDQVFAGAQSLVRWDGTNWNDVGIDIGGLYSGLLVRSSGELVASGLFGEVDGAPSAYLARKVPTCPPASFAIGAGCVGSNGAPTTSVESAPWLGATLTTRTDNLPSNGLAVVVHGFATQFTPLFPMLPQAAPGCDLLITPDIVEIAAASGGALTWSTPLPSASALGGAQFYQQVVAFELSPTLDIVDVTTANAVGFALGIFAD